MKILNVIPYFYPALAYGGPPRAVYELSRQLAARGHEVTVYATDAFDARNRMAAGEVPLTIDGIKVFYFRNLSNRLAWNSKLFISPGLIAHARKHLRDFDVINLFEFRTLQNAVIHHYAVRYGKPYTLSAWGSVMPISGKQGRKRVFDALIGRALLRDASGLIAGNSVEEGEYQKMGAMEDKIFRITVSVDVESFSHLPPPGRFKTLYGIGGRRVILFLGRINRIKGLEFLVRAFYELHQTRADAVLAIVGPDDGEKTNLETLIRELGLTGSVIFTGFLDGDDKRSALVDADMLVQTSLYERGPGSPFEAVLCDKPIIVTRNTGCSEEVEKIDAGLLVEYGDTADLALKMLRILEDPSEALQKASRAKPYILKNMSWEAVLKQYEKLFEVLVEKQRCS